MGCFSPSAPAPVDYGAQTTKTLNAQIALQPKLFAANANPNYGETAQAGLDLQSLSTLLNGKTATGTSPAIPGLNSQMATATTAQRTADIGDVFNLGPQSTAATLNADPYNAALLAKLNGQANEGLDAGATLDPDQTRDITQYARAGEAARGTNGDPGDVLGEVLDQFNAGQALKQQRQQFAQSMTGTNQAVIGDPFQQILGRPSGATATAGAMLPGNQFNPDDALSANITAGNQQNNALFSTSTVQKIQNAMAPMNSVAASY